MANIIKPSGKCNLSPRQKFSNRELQKFFKLTANIVSFTARKIDLGNKGFQSSLRLSSISIRVKPGNYEPELSLTRGAEIDQDVRRFHLGMALSKRRSSKFGEKFLISVSYNIIFFQALPNDGLQFPRKIYLEDKKPTALFIQSLWSGVSVCSLIR